MLSVMNNNVDFDDKINGSDEKHAVFDSSIEENKGRHVDDASSSGNLIETGEARVSDGVKNEKFESVAGNVDSGDRMYVDSIGGGVKAKKIKKISGGNGGSERLEVVDGSVRDTESAPRGTIRKVKKDKSGERPRKRHERVEKSSVSEELVENGRHRALEKQHGGYDIGDLVWGKVKSHPWWPGQIYNEELASSEVRRSKTEGYVLVAFFGDCSYGWFDPAELVPFETNYAEKSRQTNSRTFVKAVEEAVDEASRRRSLGLACRCRNPNNFRPTTVKGYVAVDVGDYEAGTIYSMDQIRKSRNDFKPTEILDFVNRLALSPINVEHGAIDFVKDKAATLAYRKAVYDEFDKTYAQAFGQQPELPSHGHTQDLDQPLKVPTPAPLSGPLVFAEVLRKGKGAKLTKSKDAKKDQYLFKRREPNESKTSVQVNSGQPTSTEQTVYMDGSLATASGEYAVQKKSSSVSTKQKVSGKHQQTKKSAKDGVSDPRQETGGKGGITLDDKPSVVGSSHAASQMNQASHAKDQCSHALEATSFLSKGNDAGLGSQENTGSEVGVGITISDSVANIPSQINVKDDKAGLTAIKSAESLELSSNQEATTELGGERVRDGFTGHPSGTAGVKSHKQGPYLNDGIEAKKVKVRKRPSDELKSENSIPLKKKKRKKDISSPDMKMHQYGGNVESSVGKLAKVPVSVPKSSTEDLQVEPGSKEDSISSGSLVAQKMILGENIGLELPQLLHSLQTLALNCWTGSSSSMAVVRQSFLTYRALVFEKSLVSMPSTDSESTEFSAREHPAVARAGNVAGENIRERPSLKLQRQVIRPDDPAKGGRKRGPSDRQEENAARKKKKINEMKALTAEKKTALKVLTAEKKATQKTPLMTSGSTTKSLKPAPLKKTLSPSKAPEPTMLVMKFPPQGTLPSVMELKARFARFGQLDHSGTRIFWKTSTCRLVYRNKADAESACKFAASSNNLFGNSNVRCYTRAVEVAAPITEPGKAQKEDSTMVTSQLKESMVERRPAASLPSRTLQQSGGQLRSILKKSNGDETSGTNGGGGKKRSVKFVLGEEETSRGGEQLMIGNKNMSSNASFADGGASSSTGMDFNSKNIVIPPSPLPILPLPTTTAAVHFQRPPNYLQFSELVPRNAPNLNLYAPPPTTPSVPKTDVSQQMMSLLYKCNDVVTKLSDFLGYEPLHRL